MENSQAKTSQEELVATWKELTIGFSIHFDSKPGTETAPYVA